MKNILIILAVIFSTSCFSQDMKYIIYNKKIVDTDTIGRCIVKYNTPLESFIFTIDTIATSQRDSVGYFVTVIMPKYKESGKEIIDGVSQIETPEKIVYRYTDESMGYIYIYEPNVPHFSDADAEFYEGCKQICKSLIPVE